MRVAMLGLALNACLLSLAAAVGSPHGYEDSSPWLKQRSVVSAPTGEELVADDRVPKAFDWRSVGGRSFVSTDLNQHIPAYCGACWIHGTVHALNDRIKIMRNAQFPDILLSRQALLNCVPDPSNASAPPSGCHGGDPTMIFDYLHKTQVPDDTCNPYVAKNEVCEPINVCRNCAPIPIPGGGVSPGPCFSVPGWVGYGVGDYGSVTGELAMMKEIFARGPITCGIVASDPFVFNFSQNVGVLKENIYADDAMYNMSQVDHQVEVVGWGETEEGKKYWVARNSWGTYWGDMGWFKFHRGINQMRIEDLCAWAVPTFDEVEKELRPKAKVLGDFYHGPLNLPGLDAAAQVPAEASSSRDMFVASVAAAVAGTAGLAAGLYSARSKAGPLESPLLA